jgi:putative flippase GtrA
MSASPPTSRLADVWSNHGGRFLRYSGCSAFNVVLGQALLLLFHAGLGITAWVANVLAVVIGSMPAFYLNKRYVWRRAGPVSLRTEMVPFWGMNGVGLLLSTLAVRAASSMSDSAIVVNLASLAAWASVWVIKYTLLDRFLFRSEPAAAIARS